MTKKCRVSKLFLNFSEKVGERRKTQKTVQDRRKFQICWWSSWFLPHLKVKKLHVLKSINVKIHLVHWNILLIYKWRVKICICIKYLLVSLSMIGDLFCTDMQQLIVVLLSCNQLWMSTGHHLHYRWKKEWGFKQQWCYENVNEIITDICIHYLPMKLYWENLCYWFIVWY